MSKNSVKKGKKHVDESLTAHDAVCNEFFLGDIAFTLLPIVITAFFRSAIGTLDYSFLLISDWAFASIIISSLALTRSLELKIIYQKDTRFTGVLLAKICIILVIFSTTCLTLHIIKQQCGKISDNFIIYCEAIILFASISVLYTSHLYREKLLFGRREFPKNISEKELHRYSLYNLRDARNNIRATCIAFNREYDFLTIDNDINKIKEYGKNEINRMIEDMQHDLEVLKVRMEAWNKPPYADPAISDVQDDEAK